MPIEIRELIIRTEITSQSGKNNTGTKDRQAEKLRSRLLEECRQMLDAGKRKVTRR